MPHKILFATDYSPASNEALLFAEALARQFGSVLTILHVEAAESAQADKLSQRRAELTETLTESTSSAPEPARKLVVVHGDPAAEIVRRATAEQSDLIVMATAGRSGVRRLLLGSVAREVVRKAPCTVMTVKLPAVGQHERSDDPADTVAGERVEGAEDVALKSPSRHGCHQALLLVERAIQSRATDVHIDPVDDRVLVRFRIDGRLRDYCRLNRDLAGSLATQLKVLANLDIADPFHPAEGHLALADLGSSYEARLSCMPVVGGESLAIRLLSAARLLRPLHELGLLPEARTQFEEMLTRGEGIVLVTGPAGAGKSTTVYSMVHALDDGTRNIVTIEDPVEYRVPGFRQVSVDLRHDVTMTSALRTLLRMDPDVMLVGEIRDRETADMAMRAASSGKYVFATIHTRDVASTITALRDLHIDNRSLAGNLTGIISQRLVRRLCPNCRRRAAINAAQALWFTNHDLPAPEQVPVGGGCTACRESGYLERIGVFEVVISNREVRQAIERGASEDELREVLRAAGAASLVSDGLRKVCDEITTLDEIKSMSWVSLAS